MGHAPTNLCPDGGCQTDSCSDPDPAGGPVMCNHIQQPVTGFYQGTLDSMSSYIASSGWCLASVPDPGSVVAPWQDNADGTVVTDRTLDYAMGYHFTPQVAGQVVELGGFFQGTKIVRLFDKATGAKLAQTTVSGANNWAYSAITPVSVQAGTTYTVAVYVAGSGGSYRNGITPLPRVFGDIRIEGTTYVATGAVADARPTNTVTTRMYGQADIKFQPAQ